MPTKPIVSQNSIGMIFGQLTVIREYMEPRRTVNSHIRRWECRCTCGQITHVFAADAKRKHVTSCGCFHRRRHTTHGMHNTPEYQTWAQMIQRCTNPRSKHFANYGGRGISVCQRWQDSFQDFYADMGPRPSPQHSIERQDNNGNYVAHNCRWATTQEQSRNKRTTQNVTFNGKTMCLADWAIAVNVSWFCLFHRIFKAGWSIEKALTTPSQRAKY